MRSGSDLDPDVTLVRSRTEVSECRTTRLLSVLVQRTVTSSVSFQDTSYRPFTP